MRIKPLRNLVLLRPIIQEAKTPGGLHIPERYRKRLLEASVRAVGPDVKWLSPGDRVIYDEYAGTLVKDEKGRDVLLVDEDLVIGKVVV